MLTRRTLDHAVTLILMSLVLSGCGPSDKELMDVAVSGNVVELRKHISSGVDPNRSLNISANRMVEFTSMYGHLEATQYLIEQGASLEYRESKHHWTPIEWTTAIMLAPKFSLKEDYDIASRKKRRVVCKLLQKHLKSSPLNTTIARGSLQEAETLIAEGADINEIDEYGYSPLSTAVFHEHDEIVAKLLAAGAWINVRSYADMVDEKNVRKEADPLFMPPMFAAAMSDTPAFVALLQKHGGEIDEPGWRGITPLKIACLFGNVELAKYLLDEGADPKRKDGSKGDASRYLPQSPKDKELKRRLLELLEKY